MTMTAPPRLPWKQAPPRNRAWCPLGDVDWIVFQGIAGQQLKLTTKANDLASGALLQLYDLGMGLPSSVKPARWTQTLAQRWTGPCRWMARLKISPVEIGISGTDTSYSVGIEEKNTINPGTHLRAGCHPGLTGRRIRG